MELWPKEAPRAVRNFVQLCLEGYYDGTIFHRIIKDFMVQGGDPTGTGRGGESVFGKPFRDELHSRLRFSHRGIVACANENAPNTNGSQFFFTLDKAPHLDRKATIFGKITGDTVYNLARFNEVETEEDDRPVDPPVLIRVDVLWNPFEDIKPRVDRNAKKIAEKEGEKVKAGTAATRGRRPARDLKLISFGEEVEEEEDSDAMLVSAHDVLSDSRLSKEKAVKMDVLKRSKRLAEEAVLDAPSVHKGTVTSVGAIEDIHHDRDERDSEKFAMRMRGRAEEKRRMMDSSSGRQDDRVEPSREVQETSSQGFVLARGETTKRRKENDLRISSAAVVLPSKQMKVQDRDLLTTWEARRAEYRERKRLGGRREANTMAKLDSFIHRIRQSSDQVDTSVGNRNVPATEGAEPGAGNGGMPEKRDGKDVAEDGQRTGYAGEVDEALDHKTYMPASWRIDAYMGESGDNDSLEVLRKHTLVFGEASKETAQKDAMAIKDNVDDYVVFDPLVEAGKEKFSKQEYQEKKRNTEWAKQHTRSAL